MFYGKNEQLTELLGVFKITRDSSFGQSHLRNYDTVSIRTVGAAVFDSSDGKQTCPRTNDILYIPRNAQYFQKTDGETVIAVHFLNYTFDESNSIELYSPENGSETSKLFAKMYELWSEKKPGYRYECTSLFYHLLYTINRNIKSESLLRSSISESMRDALDYIHKNYKREQISVSFLAEKAHVSESYFRREFKLLYSLSPCQCIASLRSEYAAQLLQSKLYSISEVAEKSGFDDTKYFSRFFKQKFGKTPSEYMNADIEKCFS